MDTPALDIAAAQHLAARAPLRVLIVDDERAVREGLVRLLTGDVRSPRDVFTASTPAEALALVVSVRPQVTILDVDLAGSDGLALLPTLITVASVVVLSCHGDTATRQRAQRLGAHAFIVKSAPATELLDVLTTLAASR